MTMGGENVGLTARAVHGSFYLSPIFSSWLLYFWRRFSFVFHNLFLKDLISLRPLHIWTSPPIKRKQKERFCFRFLLNSQWESERSIVLLTIRAACISLLLKKDNILTSSLQNLEKETASRYLCRTLSFERSQLFNLNNRFLKMVRSTMYSIVNNTKGMFCPVGLFPYIFESTLDLAYACSASRIMQ